ncbi:MAG: DUF4292 domain-containing protein [Candidatus Delongbacteria bacterium]|nr:DUF4292 domain-containing protein [Candidatus Delongbacteria bacterium]
MRLIKIKYMILLVSFFFSGCMLSFGVKEFDTQSVDMEVVKNRVKKNYSNLNSLVSGFEFSYTTTTDRLQSSGFLYFTGDDTLYLEINGAVGETEAVLFLTKDSVKAVNYIQKLNISDTSDDNSFNRITGINITAEKFKESLYGYEKITPDVSIIRRDELHIELKKIISDFEHKIIKLNKNLLIEEIDEYMNNIIQMKKQYDYFYDQDGIIIPKRIRIRTYDPNTKLTIFYNRININENYLIDFRMSE